LSRIVIVSKNPYFLKKNRKGRKFGKLAKNNASGWLLRGA